LFTAEVSSTQTTPPLPSIGPDRGVMPRMFWKPSKRAGLAV
jgi:hypothetical protein